MQSMISSMMLLPRHDSLPDCKVAFFKVLSIFVAITLKLVLSSEVCFPTAM